MIILSAFIVRVRVKSEVPWIFFTNYFPNVFSDVFVSTQTSLNRISTFAVTTINCGYCQDASVIILKTFAAPAVCQILY